MTFFVDANIVVYAASRGPRQSACRDLVEAVGEGAASGVTSVLALEEVWHLELSGRISGLEGVTAHAHAVFAPLLAVDDAIFERALSLALPRVVGTSDRVHAATCLENGIDVIVSADGGFDRVRGLRRVDPLNERARRRLLRG